MGWVGSGGGNRGRWVLSQCAPSEKYPQTDSKSFVIYDQISVADPGFPVGGGVDLVGRAVDPRGGYVSKILHVKMKESGPVGGGARRARPP